MAQGLGQSDLAYRQAVQDAQQGTNRLAAFEPVERLARFGQGLTGVGGMLGSVQTQTGPAAPVQSPLAGALQAAGYVNNKNKYLRKINLLSKKINIKVSSYNG